MDRLHVLRLPDMTACGRVGRRLHLGDKLVLVQGDFVLRLSDQVGVTCRQCTKAIARHGFLISWADVPDHAASVAAEKRRRKRRRL